MRIILLIFIILLSSCFQNQKPTLIIPDARTDEILTNAINPNLQKTEEAKQMMKIGEIIADEFGLHNFKVCSLCLEK